VLAPRKKLSIAEAIPFCLHKAIGLNGAERNWKCRLTGRDVLAGKVRTAVIAMELQRRLFQRVREGARPKAAGGILGALFGRRTIKPWMGRRRS